MRTICTEKVVVVDPESLRKQALKELYMRRYAVENLIRSLEGYAAHMAKDTVPYAVRHFTLPKRIKPHGRALPNILRFEDARRAPTQPYMNRYSGA